MMPGQLHLFMTSGGLRVATAEGAPHGAREPTLAEVRAWLSERGWGLKRRRKLSATPPTNGTATSNAAARSVEPRVGTLQWKVLEHLRDYLGSGLTCDELEGLMDGRHQTISARVYELSRKGLIKQSGQTRKTRSGRDAIVWVVA